jgi:hypothetical protein
VHPERSAASRRTLLRTLLVAVLSPLAVHGQTAPVPPTPTDVQGEPHDIATVDEAPLGGVIAIPLPETQRRQMKRYDVPELVGARQALGSQLVEGRLPRPLFDFVVTNGPLTQRLSLFEKGLVVVWMSGAGGTMRKKVILPSDAFAAYRKSASPDIVATVTEHDVTAPETNRSSRLRVYRDDGSHVEVLFDPVGFIPKRLADAVHPLEDLLRVISEDRTVTSSIAGYEPHVGDELVGDDRKTWRVDRVIAEANIVELHCIGQPTVIFVAKKDLYNYFVGKKAAAP